MRSKRRDALDPRASNKDEGNEKIQKSRKLSLPHELQKLTKIELIRRRNFNNAEREALYIAAGGLCEICGVQLDELWEPDHVIPFHKGGETDVSNGQAVCRPCNRAKGGRYE